MELGKALIERCETAISGSSKLREVGIDQPHQAVLWGADGLKGLIGRSGPPGDALHRPSGEITRI